MRKSYRPRDMRKSILFFFFFFKFIGLATFSVSNHKLNKNCSEELLFTGTRLGVFYNLLLGCLMIASNYVTVPILYNEEYFNKTIITESIEISQAIMASLIIFTILIYYCVNRSFLVRIGNYLVQIEGELRRLRPPMNRKRISCIFLVVCLLKFTLLVAVTYSDYLAFQTNPLSWISGILPTSLVGWFFLQYFFVLTLIDATFVNINRAIRSLYLANRFVCRSRRAFTSNRTARSLLQLRDIHEHLCDVSNDVSQFYSLPVLAALPLTFYTLLYNVYYLFEPLLVNKMSVDVVIIANTVLWIIFLLYPLGLLTTKVTKIDKTDHIVHTLLNRAIDQEIKAELKQFSLQLLHRKIKFSANGYFSLDNTLFQSVLSTVTTYLVILLQFQVGSSVPNTCYCNYTQ